MRVYLIGLPGSGKSTLGKEVAKRLNLKFVDTDEEITKKEGRSIDAIFQDTGEVYFRQLEQATLLTFSTQEDLLISTGGGAPCFFDNIEVMNKTGITIFIDVPPEMLCIRLIQGQTKQKRPMVEGKSEAEVFSFIHSKYQERIPFYSKAHLWIKGDNIQVNEVVEKIRSFQA